MLICSSGERVFITLQFSFSFCYYSHTGNCQLENNVSKRSRFDYDPRALADRGVKSIEELSRVVIALLKMTVFGIGCLPYLQSFDV